MGSTIQSEYEFTFPACGKVAYWKPLTVQRSMDVSAANRTNPEMRQVMLLVARLVKYDGTAGTPDYAVIQQLEEFDLEAFGEEVAKVEESRKATFRKERLGTASRDILRKSMEDAHALLIQLSSALKNVDEALRAEELSSPLAKTG